MSTKTILGFIFASHPVSDPFWFLSSGISFTQKKWYQWFSYEAFISHLIKNLVLRGNRRCAIRDLWALLSLDWSHIFLEFICIIIHYGGYIFKWYWPDDCYPEINQTNCPYRAQTIKNVSLRFQKSLQWLQGSYT